MNNSIENKCLIGLGSFLLLVIIQGCCEYSKRQDWIDPKFKMGLKIESYRSQGLIISKEQLLNTVGNPDYVISPEEFKGRLSVDEDLSKRFVQRLVQQYMQAKSIECSLSKEHHFYQNYEFDKTCILWLYDESIHFKKPANSPIFSMCADIGFSCYCFYVENDKVIGVASFGFWKPLKPVK